MSGRTTSDNLIKTFKMPRFNTSGYTDITKNFNDVFESTCMTSYDLSLEDIRKYNKLKKMFRDYNKDSLV